MVVYDGGMVGVVLVVFGGRFRSFLGRFWRYPQPAPMVFYGYACGRTIDILCFLVGDVPPLPHTP